MKNLKNYLVLSLSLICAIHGYAFPQKTTSPTTFQIISTDQNSFKFLMKKADSGVTQIELFSLSDGKILFSDQINARCVYWKHFVIENIGNAEYQIVITEQHKTTIVAIKSYDGRIQSGSKDHEVIYHPIIKFANNHLDINWLLTQPEKVIVKIIDTNTNFQSIHTLATSKAVNKRFNLNTLPIGDYLITLSANGRSYSKHFTK